MGGEGQLSPHNYSHEMYNYSIKCTVHVETVHCNFLSRVLRVTSMVLYYGILGMCSTFFKN